MIVEWICGASVSWSTGFSGFGMDLCRQCVDECECFDGCWSGFVAPVCGVFGVHLWSQCLVECHFVDALCNGFVALVCGGGRFLLTDFEVDLWRQCAVEC